MEAIDKVRAKRKAIRFASTKFVNKVKSFLETFDSQNETHQEQLSEYLLNLDAKQIELQTLNKKSAAYSAWKSEMNSCLKHFFHGGRKRHEGNRIKSRLTNSFDGNEKNPTISSNDYFASLIVYDCQEKVLHNGVKETLTQTIIKSQDLKKHHDPGAANPSEVSKNIVDTLHKIPKKELID
ncbi:uncharacterized protein TNCT_520081 [Trichonephila clavata]|uniref:Uncharacterized protein n=1 Tax=Trichonephila clavata TaxID=2740835 RepID=A0A8X6GK96_TRICU|nr:uncharacterized protein TNCT_520081 [Trichonephila clavata]